MLNPLVAAMLGIALFAPQDPPSVTVRDSKELKKALAGATPGVQILLAPGEYSGGTSCWNLRGEPGRRIVIAAADPRNPPVLKGGSSGFYFSNPAHLEVRDLVITGVAVSGINIDDGGFRSGASTVDIILRGLKVADTGSDGNHDGLKLSGLRDFRVEGCTLERWGKGGEGIDMVGCHDGTIEGNLLRHDGQSLVTGVQMKGGTSRMSVRRNRFENVGGRGINLGGCTGPQFFRPPLETPPFSEARDILVEGNTFIGGNVPFAFVGTDGATVRFNTVYRPKRWALRILQENREDGFVPSRNGRVTDNLFVFRSDDWSEGGVNLGEGSDPKSFRFERNWWTCLNDPEGTQRRVRLPTGEIDGVYGRDPLFRDAEKGDLTLRPDSPAGSAGAPALPR